MKIQIRASIKSEFQNADVTFSKKKNVANNWEKGEINVGCLNFQIIVTITMLSFFTSISRSLLTASDLWMSSSLIFFPRTASPIARMKPKYSWKLRILYDRVYNWDWLVQNWTLRLIFSFEIDGVFENLRVNFKTLKLSLSKTI